MVGFRTLMIHSKKLKLNTKKNKNSKNLLCETNKS